MSVEGTPLLDSNGDTIIVNYERYLPNLSQQDTWLGLLCIVLGLGILLGLDWYGKNRKETV